MKYRGKVGVVEVQIQERNAPGLNNSSIDSFCQPVPVFNQKSKADLFSVIVGGINISDAKQANTKTYVSHEVENLVNEIFTQNVLLIAWAVALAVGDKFQFVLVIEKRALCLRLLEIQA